MHAESARLIEPRANRIVFFEVGDIASDGYHPVASVYQALSLYEEVTARRST